TAHLDGAPAALLVGMLLGDKHAIPASVASQFRATGLAHALVISGLHVGLIVIFLLTLMRVARVPDAIACSATVVLLVIYAFVTQMQAPVVRASLMAAIVLVGRAVELRGSVLNSLGLAALVLMVVQPTSLLTLSFQLSFAATLAIVTLHGPFMSLWPSHWLAETSRVGKWILVPATVSLAAQVGTLPLIVFHFQQLAPLSLLANLLVVPLLGLAVAQGLLLALVAPIVPAAAPMISGAIWLTLTGLMKIVAVFSALTPWQVAQPTPSEALSWMSLTALTIVAIYRPGLRRVSLLLALLTANVWIWHKVWDPAVLDIVFLDVGQGDAAFVRFPDGKTMIIDAGMRSRHIDMGERVVVPWLRRQGVEVVDVVVASHPHADHIGGLVSLLEQIKVRHFVDGGQNYDSWTSLRLRQLIERRQITYHAVRGGDSLAGLGGAGGLILHPTASFVDSSGLSTMGLNNGSVVFRLDYGERRVLFTGDIEHETDRSVTRWGSRLHADILKVAHHGSRTSSAAVFLDVVRPSVAVISVGAHNKFRHPASPVVTRLQAHADVRRTDQDGAIMIRISNTGQMRVSQQLTDDPGHRSVDKSRPSR
ncbi:MAG: DNA internalization-related competence protein ComEC/Rec2, partial [Gemmatimonadetes bacterium]|nr:DNA internalization-related competence protein ComEC/Rec2 [Gemmatimonadota bacterium]